MLPSDLDYLQNVANLFYKQISAIDFFEYKVDCFCITILVIAPSGYAFAVTVFDKAGSKKRKASFEFERLQIPKQKKSND